MFYLKFGIVLFTLLILSNNFSFVFAQSMYDFKGKDTNISPLYPHHSGSKKSSGISRDSKDYQSKGSRSKGSRSKGYQSKFPEYKISFKD